MRSRTSNKSVVRSARPISVLMFLLLFATLQLACTGGITGLEPPCSALGEEDFPTGEACYPVLTD